MRSCINPAHLRQVTHDRNMQLARPYRVLRPTCKRGHAIGPHNTYPGDRTRRSCMTCHRAMVDVRKANVPLGVALRKYEAQFGTTPARKCTVKATRTAVARREALRGRRRYISTP
ncbi:hypothetical protein [Actinocatenispora comari]|uniref:hypothetical protein n=1 Tax=Actinocatenispora comari TaxID=2807577 RepID=UPI00351A0486